MGAILLGLLPWRPLAPDQAAPAEGRDPRWDLLVLYTGAVQGQLEPCG